MGGYQFKLSIEESTMINLYNKEYVVYNVTKDYMKTRKIIAISVENYDKLKTFGHAGESMNLAVGKLLKMATGAKLR